jgi:hypothetical protein
VAWQTERDNWLSGAIPPTVAYDDVRNWLEKDLGWEQAKITWTNGNHFAKIYIRGMSQIKKRWASDLFDVSSESRRTVKKWVVEELVDAYQALQDCD